MTLKFLRLYWLLKRRIGLNNDMGLLNSKLYINDIKKENEEIQRKLTEAQKEIEKKDKRYLDYIKEKSEEYDIVDNLNFEFTMKTKPKNEFVIQSMPDLVTVEGNMVKGDGLETVGNKEDLNKDEEEKKEEAKIELVNDDEPTGK